MRIVLSRRKKDEIKYRNAFHPLLNQGLRIRFRRVTSNSPNLEFLGRLFIRLEGFDHGSALDAGGAEDDDDFGR